MHVLGLDVEKFVNVANRCVCLQSSIDRCKRTV